MDKSFVVNGENIKVQDFKLEAERVSFSLNGKVSGDSEYQKCLDKAEKSIVDRYSIVLSESGDNDISDPPEAPGVCVNNSQPGNDPSNFLGNTLQTISGSAVKQY